MKIFTQIIFPVMVLLALSCCQQIPLSGEGTASRKVADVLIDAKSFLHQRGLDSRVFLDQATMKKCGSRYTIYYPYKLANQSGGIVIAVDEKTGIVRRLPDRR